MFDLGSLLTNVSNSAVTQPIPLSITTSTSPEQFWISTGVALLVGGGIFCIPMLMGKGNPIKKAKAINAFSKLTGRQTLVIDHSKASLFKPAMIDNGTVTTILNAMDKLQGRDFNMILNSGGGQVFSSQLISDAMQKYKGRIEVYIPKYGMSGATLLALSGSNIHMTDYSSLGMLDAQIGSILSQGPAAGWDEIVKLKGARANDNSILHSRLGKQVTNSLRENVFNLVKNKTPRAEQVVSFLTSGDREHIYQVKKSKMLEMGFNNIVSITPQENRLLLEIVG